MKIINHDKRVGANMDAQRRESVLSSHIQHPNVVTTYKVGCSPPTSCMDVEVRCCLDCLALRRL